MRQSDKREWWRLACLGVAVIAAMFLFACSPGPQRMEAPHISPQEMAGHLLKPVVRITMTSKGVGSGVVVESIDSTLIITNHHVVQGEDWLKVELDGKTYDATIVKHNEERDLALLKIDTVTDHVAHLHSSTEAYPFEHVVLVGCGMGRSPYPSLGIIADVHGDFIMYTGHVVQGMSGGGMFRRHFDHYELVGIIKAHQMQPLATPFGVMGTPVNNMGLVIPLSVIQEFLDD